MESYIDLEVDYKKKLFKVLNSIERITIKDEKGNLKVGYIKEGAERYMEGINDKATS